MHESVMNWARSVITADDVTGKRVIEVGSYDVNGSVRPFITAMSPAAYTGTDMRPGPGVDMVMDAAELAATLGHGSADLVVSTEMLEHARDWRAAVDGMVSVLAENGVLAITARGPGFPLHDYPEDHWRFTTEDMRQIITAAGLQVEGLQSDPQVPGVFCRARKPSGWTWPDQAVGWDHIHPEQVGAVMTNRTMYDSVDPNALPRTAELVAGYVTGRFRWAPNAWGHWPREREVHIDVNGSYPEDSDVLDIERFDAEPSQARAWIEARVPHGRACLYFSRSRMDEIEAAITGLPGVDVWVADWTSTPHTVPVAPNMHLVAVQYENTPHYDLSVVFDPVWPWGEKR